MPIHQQTSHSVESRRGASHLAVDALPPPFL